MMLSVYNDLINYWLKSYVLCEILEFQGARHLKNFLTTKVPKGTGKDLAKYNLLSCDESVMIQWQKWYLCDSIISHNLHTYLSLCCVRLTLNSHYTYIFIDFVQSLQ